MTTVRTHRTGRTRRAFTLIEVIVVIIILGVIATLVAPRILGRIGQSKTGIAKSNATSLAGQVKMYWADCGPPPAGSTINILWERPSDVDATKWKGPYVDNKDALNDPWGKPFVLVIPGVKNVDFDVVTYGADGQAGGEDENQDVVAP